MNKDYKLMALLIPIILILSFTLYIFPDASNQATNIATPLNQINNTSSNQSSTNISSENTPVNPLINQNSQGTSINNYNPPTNNANTGSNNRNTNTDTNNQDNPITPTEPINNSTSWIKILFHRYKNNAIVMLNLLLWVYFQIMFLEMECK